MSMNTVSLFSGFGGETSGKLAALREAGIKHQAYAVNHWDLAVSTHRRNFPTVKAACEDIHDITAEHFDLDRINLLWASPSCVHHSRARGGKPCEDQQRSHAWEVIHRWIDVVPVDVFLMENVPEFEQWGPLDKNDRPIKSRRGEHFHAFVQALRDRDYTVSWRVLCAADYGDPTIRKRLFLQASRDGIIAWPEPTHRDPSKPADMWTQHLPPWRTAAECIDWSIPVPSIFDRKRPLADATCRRIAHGEMRYVVEAAEPFIVQMRGTAPDQVRASGRPLNSPLGTVSSGGIHHALVAPTLIQTGQGERKGQRPRYLDIHKPLGTVVAGGQRHGLVAAFLAKHYGGVIGTPLTVPTGTVTSTDHHAVVTAGLGNPVVDVERGRQVAAFLVEYYGTGGAKPLTSPLGTVTTLDRHGLVTVEVDGDTYAIVDIGMRMLQPRELARAQGFPDSFRLEDEHGNPLTKTAAVKMIGNACPHNTTRALIRAQAEARGEAWEAAA